MSPVQFFKCMADETRLKCVLLIAQNKELCVCEMTTALNASQPKISRHLAQLRECGLLKDRRAGQWIFYSINPELPPWAMQIIETTTEANSPFTKAEQRQLSQMDDRPGRLSRCC